MCPILVGQGVCIQPYAFISHWVVMVSNVSNSIFIKVFSESVFALVANPGSHRYRHLLKSCDHMIISCSVQSDERYHFIHHHFGNCMSVKSWHNEFWCVHPTWPTDRKWESRVSTLSVGNYNSGELKTQKSFSCINQSVFGFQRCIIPADFLNTCCQGPRRLHFAWFTHSTLAMQIRSLSLLPCLSGSSPPAALDVPTTGRQHANGSQV